ncbi:MAG: Phosphoheptose isomerase 1 [Fimbriimonadaceae bacterium]|nr:Phosphoheptose isomerase 1 [Fimbriimonadaceae bacterium]
MPDAFEGAFRSATAALEALRQDADLLVQLSDLASDLETTIQKGGKILVAGNGGSMADAMHFAEECTGRFRRDREPIAALALTDPTHLSCVANDYGYEQVFRRLVTAYGRPGDHLILLSTSGKSPNLIEAASAAKSGNVGVTALLGRGGGPLRDVVTRAIIFPGEGADRIQELHMLALHALVESLESRLGHVQ